MPVKKSIPNRFRVIRQLGVGGTARICLAEILSNSHQYALKMPLSGKPDSIGGFKKIINREYDLIGQLNYPGLIRLIELNSDDNQTQFLVMEYCSGITLDSCGRIENQKALLNILSSISINLYYLQLAKIFHGDIKPHNIFLGGDVENWSGRNQFYTKISDFSLALKEDETAADRLGLGTLGYSAPEVIDNMPVDYRSDIFSLGVLAYQLATGKHPFMENETDPVRINSMIKELTPQPPHLVQPDVPETLSELIKQMLEKKQSDRPIDGYEICRQLEKIGATYPFKKAIRPKYLCELQTVDLPEQFLNNHLYNFRDNVKNRLLDYCGKNKQWLRHILEINFSLNNLVWKNGRLEFKSDRAKFIVPKRIKGFIRESFRRLSYSERKKATLASIVGNLEDSERLGILKKEIDSGIINRPLIFCLEQKLSRTTKQRFGLKLADRAKDIAGDNLLASMLYLKAGDIDRAFSIIIDSANELINENKHDRAFDLLGQLERLCESKNETHRRRVILMIIADTQKKIGEISQAEKTYLKIIQSYGRDEKILEQAADGILAETYKDLGDIYKMKSNYQEGINWLGKAEQLYRKLGNELELSHTLNNIGNIELISSRLDEALISFRKALKIQRKLNVPNDVASTLNNMAAVYYYRGRYRRTLFLFNMAAKLQREIGHAGELARTLNNLGCVYHDIGDFDQAIEQLEESIDLNRRIGSQKELLFNLENFSNVMLSAGRLKDSLQYLKEGISLSHELSDLPHSAFFFSAMARAHKRMGYYGRASENIEEALTIHEKINDNQHFLICLIEKADILLRLNDREAASQLIEDIISRADKINDKKAEIYGLLLKGRLNKDIDSIDGAIELADKCKLRRTKETGYLRKIEILLENKKYTAIKSSLDKLASVFEKSRSDIEISRYVYLSGIYQLNNKSVKEAQKYFERAQRLAKESALLPEMIDSSITLGQMLVRLGDHEKAFESYKLALNLVKIIAGDIKDLAHKNSYLSDPKIELLGKEIGCLNQILSGHQQK